jgi:predicted RecA/RadA family phage recombinase
MAGALVGVSTDAAGAGVLVGAVVAVAGGLVAVAAASTVAAGEGAAAGVLSAPQATASSINSSAASKLRRVLIAILL